MKNSSKRGVNRDIASIILSIGFLIVGIGNLMLGNIPITVGLLVGALTSLFVFLYYLTKEHRQMKQVTRGRSK
jgi:O-antigen/teichoic acid export membrane protein